MGYGLGIIIIVIISLVLGCVVALLIIEED
jgi:hypothetical protein